MWFTQVLTQSMHASHTGVESQGSQWQYTVLSANKSFFIISGAESAYGDDSLHIQTLTVGEPGFEANFIELLVINFYY